MKEISIQFLLAEYDRLKHMEQYWLEHYQRALQFHLTIVSGVVGVLVLLLDKNTPFIPVRFEIILLISVTIILGEITFIWMMRADSAMLLHANACNLIRAKFFKLDPELEKAFPKGLTQNKKKYQVWSSFRGIVSRVVSNAQYKSLVVVLNCLAITSLAIILSLPKPIFISVLIGIGAFTIAGILHVVYAKWRYKIIALLLAKNENDYWL